MDYSKLSDAEINALVARITGVHFDEEGPCHFDYSGIDSPYSDGEPLRVSFDPCNNPSDAWPIIVDSKISILYEGATGKWNSGKAYWVDGVEWQVSDDVFDRNPLRAAMIVFLMMQEKTDAS